MRRACLLPLIFGLVACGDTEAETQPTDPPDEEATYTLDTDGDGLADVQEIAGWFGVVHSVNGRAEHHYVSDPEVADADFDGLSDYDEFIAKTNPAVPDTDFDGLTDREEVVRWGTNPNSVDTDGDSRGPDPVEGAPMDARLFDGAELRLVEDPLRPGIMLAGALATSPLTPDTDGDGMSDFEELKDRRRNPVIAELPSLNVRLNPRSNVGIFLNVVDTITRERVAEYNQSFTRLQAVDYTEYAEAVLETAMWVSAYLEVVAEASVSVAPQAGSASASAEIGGTLGGSAKTALKIGFDGNERRGFREFGERVKAETTSTTREVQGGTLVMSVDFTNTSSIPFSVRLPTVNAFYSKSTRRGRSVYSSRPLATLTPENPELAYTLEPGESVEVVVSDDDIDGGRTLEFLEGSAALYMTAANFEIVDENLRSYDYVIERAREQSAMVQLDFGDGRVVTEHIAANVQRSLTGKLLGFNLTEAFDLLGITWDIRPETPGLVRIEDFPTLIYDTPAPDLQAMGLDAPGYRYTSGPGERMLKDGWLALAMRDGKLIGLNTDLRKVRARPGDLLRIVRVRDNDRDGLTNYEEALHGTSDEDVDTDGDGLSDFWEVHEGWLVAPVGQAPRRVQSSPLLADSDSDTLLDTEEYELGYNPLRVDTDSDNLSDTVDPRPLRFDDLALESYFADLDDCSVDGCFNADPNTPDSQFLLYWEYPDPDPDGLLPPIEEVLIMREVVPIDDSGRYEPFIASTLRTESGLALANQRPNIRVVYRGAGEDFVDAFPTPRHQHIYHFYSIFRNALGERAYVYSGSDGQVFSPNYPTTPLIEVGVFEPQGFRITQNIGSNVRLWGVLTAAVNGLGFSIPTRTQDRRWFWWNSSASEAYDVGGASFGQAANFFPLDLPNDQTRDFIGLSVCVRQGSSFNLAVNYNNLNNDGSSSPIRGSVDIPYARFSQAGPGQLTLTDSTGRPVGAFVYRWTYIGAYNEIEAGQRCRFGL